MADIAVNGSVTNVTYGNVGGVAFHILSTDGGKTYRAVGAYDGKTLWGKFDLPGKVVSSDGKATCLVFTGELLMGDDGSGLPSGTKAEYVMSIMLGGEGAKGVYRLGKIPPTMDLEQYGTMDLSLAGDSR